MTQRWTKERAPSAELVWMQPSGDIREAARLMEQRHVSSVLVGGPGALHAIVTERDITYAVADGMPLDRPVRELVQSSAVAIDVSATVSDAAARMLEADVRHLVITRDGEAVGIISVRDALGALLAAADAPMLVELMRRCVSSHTELWLG